MNPWKTFKDHVVTQNKIDEEYYAAALEEFCSGQVRPGLMAKAIAESGGDENKAKAAYIRLLANAIRDDQYLAHRMYEEATKAHGRAQEQIREERARALVLANPKKDEDSISWVGVVVVVFFIGIIWAKMSGNESRSTTATSQPPPVQRPQSPPPPSSYDRLLASYEKKYPIIDPGSPYFNEGFTNQVAQKMSGYRSMGYSADDALRLAIEASFPASPATKPRSVESQVSSPPIGCEYKAVMSDDDYRACNITPPTVR